MYSLTGYGAQLQVIACRMQCNSEIVVRREGVKQPLRYREKELAHGATDAKQLGATSFSLWGRRAIRVRQAAWEQES